MKPAFFQRLPWWLWLGWAVHLVSYALPSYSVSDQETAYGWKCAHIAYHMWFSGDGFLSELWKGQMETARGEAVLGWFNVTNLAALFAPWLIGWFRRPWVIWWEGLLCLTGAAQAVAFGLGVITRAREYDSLRLGFYIWLVSYVWLATGAFVVWRRIRTPTTIVAASEAGRSS